MSFRLFFVFIANTKTAVANINSINTTKTGVVKELNKDGFFLFLNRHKAYFNVHEKIPPLHGVRKRKMMQK